MRKINVYTIFFLNLNKIVVFPHSVSYILGFTVFTNSDAKYYWYFSHSMVDDPRQPVAKGLDLHGFWVIFIQITLFIKQNI